MDNPAYVVALVLGAVMLLSVCFVYVRHQVLQFGGMALTGFAVILVGMPVWKTIDVSMDEKGFNAKLNQAIAQAEAATEQASQAKAQVVEAQKEAQEVKKISQLNSQAALALKESLEAMKAQESLRNLGMYHGALDGQLGATTKQSLIEFQASKHLPKTGELDPNTIKALGITPIQKFPELRVVPRGLPSTHP